MVRPRRPVLRPAGEHLAGDRAGGPRAVPDAHAADPHALHPGREHEGSWKVERSAIVAGSNSTRSAIFPAAMRAAIGELQPRRRRGRHLPDRLRQREPVLLAHELPEHARERAGAARMAQPDAAVARRPSPMAACRTRRMSSSTIDFPTTLAPPSLTIWMKRSTGVMPFSFAIAVERLELVLGMRRVAIDRHVLRAADVVQRFSRRWPDRRSACWARGR